MKRLYEKNESLFAIVWIIIYVVSMSWADSISESLGAEKTVSLPILCAMSVFLFVWVRKNHLEAKYGFATPQKKWSDLLYFLPLILTVLSRLAGGFYMADPRKALLQFVSMLFVGFMEELLFRGFLFCAMAKDGIRSAVIVSAATFGIGHIVNLFNGSGMSAAENILQISFAIIFGFCMVFLFYYGKSLWPCIITHGLFNAFGTITMDSDVANGHISVLFILQVLLMAAYALYLWYRLKKEKQM